MCLCGPRSFFGQEEIVLGLNSRATRAKCISLSGVLYKISKEKLLENFGQFGILDALKNESQKRGNLLSKRERVTRMIAQSGMLNFIFIYSKVRLIILEISACFENQNIKLL